MARYLRDDYHTITKYGHLSLQLGTLETHRMIRVPNGRKKAAIPPLCPKYHFTPCAYTVVATELDGVGRPLDGINLIGGGLGDVRI